MKRNLLLMIMVMLSSCTGGCTMSDDEVAAAVKHCQDRGMQAAIYGRLWTARVVDVVCVPKADAR